MSIQELIQTCNMQKQSNAVLLVKITKFKNKVKEEIMKELTFRNIVDMFSELQKKGYTVQEILTMPVTVGDSEVLCNDK